MGESFADRHARIQEKLRADQEWREREQSFPFSEQYSRLKERAPGIEKLQVLTLDQLLEREGVDVDGLKSKVDGIIAELTQDDEFASGGRIESLEVVELLFQLYSLVDSDKARLGEWGNSFKNWDAFFTAYLGNVDSKHVVGTQVQIQFFIQNMMQPQQFLRGMKAPRDPYAFRLRTFCHEHDWKLLPGKPEQGERYQYTTREVIEEVIELLEQGYHRPDFSHASGSAALDGIASSSGIVCSRLLRERAGKVATGEFGRGRHSYHALANVYASRGLPFGGYETMNWFNEFPVQFGVNKQRHDAFLSEYYPEIDETYDHNGPPLLNYSGIPKTRIHDWGGEGMLLGPEVKLESIDILYCPRRNLEELKAWAQVNAPHAKVVSLEAVELLGYGGERVREWALAEEKDPKDVWNIILES